MPRRYPEKIGKIYRFRRKDSTAIKALKMAHNLKSLINVEYKKHDRSADQSVDNTGTIHNLTLIAQGEATGNRIGNSVLKKFMLHRGVLASNTAASTPEQQVRLIWFIWHSSRGTAPTIAEVLESTEPLAPLNKDLSYTECKILKDKLVVLVPDTGSGRSVASIKFNYKFPQNAHIKFNGGSGSESNLESGGVYLLMLSNKSTNAPDYDYYNRITYIDN